MTEVDPVVVEPGGPGRRKQDVRLVDAFRLLFSRDTRWKLVAAVLGTTLVAFAETAALLLVAPLVQLLTGSPTDSGVLGLLNGVLGGQSREQLTMYLVTAVVAGFILKDIATMVFRWWMLGFMARQQIETASRLMDHYLRSPYSLHLTRSASDLMKTLGLSLQQVYGQAVMGTLSAVTELITVAAILTGLFVAMPLQTLAVALYFGLAAVLFVRVVRPSVQRANEVALQATHDSLRATLHALEGVKEIQVRGSYEEFVDDYERANWSGAAAGRLASYMSEAPKYILEILFMVGMAIVIATMGSGADGASLLGSVALLVAASFRILPSITRATASITSVRAGRPALREVTHELTAAAARPPAPSRRLVTPMPFDHALQIDDLTFRYRPDSPRVLKDVSLTIPAGTSLALVGGSGAGKSTLVDLILGLHTPTGGFIRADGRDVATDIPAWQRNVAMVPQDVYLLDATLRQNIAFTLDDSGIYDARIWEAVAKAQLKELVDELDDGLETRFGARGVRLSGGQRQRIGIARALYRQPKLLVLDEATSALDNETEHKITGTIRSLAGEMTIIIVAHRLSTVRDADALAFMKGGRVQSVGTFDEVRATNTDFAHLVELGTLEPRERRKK